VAHGGKGALGHLAGWSLSQHVPLVTVKTSSQDRNFERRAVMQENARGGATYVKVIDVGKVEVQIACASTPQ
jgi:hypothetical protein